MTELSNTRNDVPNVSSAGINASAKMVWQAVQATDSFKHYATRGRLQGIPGHYWVGAVNSVINDLWPALNDRYLTDKELAEELKLALNRFLRVNRAMVCTRDGGLVKKSVWFVVEHWPELTVTPGPGQGASRETPVVTDEAATTSPTTVGKSGVTPLDVFDLKKPAPPAAEERSEEAMNQNPVFQEPEVPTTPEPTDDVIYHACRLDGCKERFEGMHHRATHEMKHGFRWNEDGTVTNFDVNAPIPDEEETQALIAKVCEGAEPMNQAQIVEAVRKDTPKALSPTVKIVLQIMTDEGWFELLTRRENVKGQIRRFKWLGEPVKKAKKAKKVLAEVVEEKVDALILKEEKPGEAGFSETLTSVLTGALTAERRARYEGLFQDLMADLHEIDRLKAQIERMEHSHEVTRQELRRTVRERDEALAKAGNGEELARVTAERDELQGKLNTLKLALGSL